MSTSKREIKKELMKLSKPKISALCKKHNISLNSTATKIEMINKLIPKIHSKKAKKAKNKASKPINGNYLVSGFMRAMDKKENCAYSVIEIIIQYIMSMFSRFDTCNQKYIQCIKSNGTVIDREVYMTTNKYKICKKPNPMREITKVEMSTIVFACSKGYNKGITKFKIKVDRVGISESRLDLVRKPMDAIGIISKYITDIINYDQQNITLWRGESYYLFQNSFIGTGLHSSKSYQAGLGGINIIDWKDGDIISVTLNCKKWTVEFRLNGKKIGRPVDIAKKCTYHLALYSTCNHSKYSLLTPFV
eukprot:513293_1